jgi:hypothetical protein
MSNVTVTAFTPTKIFPVKPQKLTIIRKYEDSEYAFTAGDLSFDCSDAEDLYDEVTSGEAVTLVVVRNGVTRFRGTFQSEGTSYDPDKDTYSFAALHAVKKVFDLAKARTEYDLFKNIYTQIATPTNAPVFDVVKEDDLHNSGICAVKLDPTNFAYADLYRLNALPSKPPTDIYQYGNFMKANQSYTTRDYWIDFCKHYRCVVYLDNDLDEGGNYVLHVVPRIAISKLNPADDNLICGYNEQQNNPQYDAVIFPFFSNGVPCYGKYSASGAEVFSAAPQIDSGENVLDLRVPSGAYDGGKFPFKSLPDFNLSLSNPNWFMSSMTFKWYCDQNFGSLVKPYKAIDVTYREIIDLNPIESKVVRGVNIPIIEVEDDLMNETTKITGRLFHE